MKYPQPQVENIEKAYHLIDPVFLNSPQYSLDALDQYLGLNLTLKVETQNPIRSFKGRGSDFFVKSHQEQRAFVCASAGNFGQGMAYACRAQGIKLQVFAAESANPLKIERMRQFGAEVILAGHDFDAAKAAARAYAAEHDRPFVEDGEAVEITEGAGTMGLELGHLAQSKPYDALFIAVGNGALVNGIGTWFKAKHPQTRIIGVVAHGAPAMALSWESGQIQTTQQAATISDGIEVRVPVAAALETMQETVDQILRVSDEETLAAMRLLHEMTGLVVEPAGAVGLAAIIQAKEAFAQQKVASIICGSNLTPQQIKRWL